MQPLLLWQLQYVMLLPFFMLSRQMLLRYSKSLYGLYRFLRSAILFNRINKTLNLIHLSIRI